MGAPPPAEGRYRHRRAPPPARGAPRASLGPAREVRVEEESAEIRSRGSDLAATVFRPEGGGPHPAVVMAHGFGSVRAARLPAYARWFREAGILTVLFDYRHFGDSGGHPRQLLSVRRQIQDWKAALHYTRDRPDVDASRTALWGTSFSGGHVVRVAAGDGDLAAVVSQVPMASGLATALRLPARSALKVGLAAVADLLRSALGGSPFYVPITDRPGKCAAIALDEAVEGYCRLHEGVEWDDRVCARIGLGTLLYRPHRCARRVGAPLLVQVAGQDPLTPPGPAQRMARKAPRGRVSTYPIGHFDIYFDPWFETAVEEQTAFLAEHLRPSPVADGSGAG